MMCPHCGQQLNDDAAFCIACGCRLYQVEPPRPKKNKTTLILAVLLAISVTAAAVFAFLYFRNRPEQEPVISADQEILESTSAEVTDTEPADTAQPQETGETNPADTTPPQETTETIQPTEPPVPTQPPTEPPKPTQPAQQPTEPPADDGRKITPETPDAPVVVGIPLPSASEEARKQAYDLYWQTITAEEKAVSYSLLNMLGDDIPELIIQCGNGGSESYYCMYFLLNGQLLPVSGATIPAGQKDVLLGNNGDLLICHQGSMVTTVDIDLTLTARIASSAVAEGSIEYTDSVLTENAGSCGLLDLILLGDSGKTGYNGWVRFDNRDYFYANKRPVTKKWRKDDGVLYYLGAGGYITHKAEAEALDVILQEYCQSFMDAVNNQDVSLLKNVTEAYKHDVQALLNLDEYKYRNYSEFDCDSRISSQSDGNGSVTLTARIKWTYCGEWEGAQTTTQNQLCYVTLIYQDGQWLINKLEYSGK